MTAVPPSTEYSVRLTPDRLSVAESVIDTSVFVNEVGTADADVIGGVRSILTGALVDVFALPARSSTVRESDCATPSVVIAESTGQVAVSTPESASPHVQWIVTAWL